MRLFDLPMLSKEKLSSICPLPLFWVNIILAAVKTSRNTTKLSLTDRVKVPCGVFKFRNDDDDLPN